jgi:hypothetical protein
VSSQDPLAVLLEIDLIPIHESGTPNAPGFIRVNQFSFFHLGVLFNFGELIPPRFSFLQDMISVDLIYIFEHNNPPADFMSYAVPVYAGPRGSKLRRFFKSFPSALKIT